MAEPKLFIFKQMMEFFPIFTPTSEGQQVFWAQKYFPRSPHES